MNNNKILIAIDDSNGIKSKLSMHFGHCPFFAIYDLMSKKLEIVENKINHSDKVLTPVDQIMRYKPDIVFSLGVGQRALNLFDKENVKVKTGDFKIVEEVIENLDNLKDLNNGCLH